MHKYTNIRIWNGGFVGRSLCTNIATESKCKNERTFYFLVSSSLYISITYMKYEHMNWISSDRWQCKFCVFFFPLDAASYSMQKHINQCNCRHDDFKLLIHLFLLVRSQWNAKPFGCSQIYRLIKFCVFASIQIHFDKNYGVPMDFVSHMTSATRNNNET